ncbi:glycosyltransferase [Polynucleobacter sp. MWH-UH24A]|uniref:glycosyltransferase family 2 protein n=1 Tax=Polynucleobacter sp. MWH-UH24A TaxID=2689110 RepID=UPI001BFE7086|nr:glycosyltransferase [Polynucleobacter sp. MWH-UH24A]QWD76386.1 glycosyltransferase [Polynucleobacter sp. MWH-UH24A]
MSTQALVSVIMPAFNSEKYIAQAIESILAQTYTNFELLIFDDGSSDQTRAVIHRYVDPRIIKVLSDQNRGVVFARNKMIDMAKGQYIALMDADDIADPMRFEKQVLTLEAQACDVCGSAQWVLDDATKEIKKSKDKFSDSDLRSLLAVYCTLCNSAVMARAELFKRYRYDTTILTSEDYYLWVQIAAAGYRFLNLPERLVTYRQYPAQTSSVHLEKFKLSSIEVQKRYLTLLGIDVHLRPNPLPWRERMYPAIQLLKALKVSFPKMSFKAYYEIYARFQYRRSGIWTPLTRLERILVCWWVMR